MKSFQRHMINPKAMKMLYPLVCILFLNGSYLEYVLQGSIFSCKGILSPIYSKQLRWRFILLRLFLILFFFFFWTATRGRVKPINLKICFPFLFYLQLLITACITMTIFLQIQMDIDILHANYYMGSLFYALVIFLVDGIPEVSMTIQRLEVFYKQKHFVFTQLRQMQFQQVF